MTTVQAGEDNNTNNNNKTELNADYYYATHTKIYFI